MRKLPLIFPSQKLNSQNLLIAKFEYSLDGTFKWELNDSECLHLYLSNYDEGNCNAIIVKDCFAIDRNDEIKTVEELLLFLKESIIVRTSSFTN